MKPRHWGSVRESVGNATLLILLDTSRAESLHLPEALFSALNHLGMPYRALDVARVAIRTEDLLMHRAVVVGQEHFGNSLSAEAAANILRAVQSGVGLVNFDHDLGRYADIYRDALRLVGNQPSVATTAALVIRESGHYITSTRDSGEQVTLRHPVPMYALRTNRNDDRAALASPSGMAALCTGTLDQGRFVQWLVSPKIWLTRFLGHTRGLDDLFWKGIVWAARKPFVMKAMPPFVQIRLDDCDGYWRNASDFDFVNVLNEAGYVPSLGLCLRAVTDEGGRRLRMLFEENRAEFCPHVLSPGRSLFFGDDGGEYSTAQFAVLMSEVDEALKRWGIRPSRVLCDHMHMWSERVMPLLLERGITFRMNVMLPGEQWESPHVDWCPGPYGQMAYAFDAVPGHPEFFIAFNHFGAIDAALSYLPDGRFLFDRSGAFGDVHWDFLSGLTKSSLGRNDLDAMARRFARFMRVGLDSLFFGGVFTNSRYLKDLSPSELREVLQQVESLTRRHAKVFARYETIAEYARSKVDTHLSRAEVSADGKEVAVRLVGRATVPLELYVFRDDGAGVSHRFQTVGDCDGVQHARFDA